MAPKGTNMATPQQLPVPSPDNGTDAPQRAYIESKIEMIRKDPKQTDEEKTRTIEMLRDQL
jgi:hypothetical protein